MHINTEEKRCFNQISLRYCMLWDRLEERDYSVDFCTSFADACWNEKALRGVWTYGPTAEPECDRVFIMDLTKGVHKHIPSFSRDHSTTVNVNL